MRLSNNRAAGRALALAVLAVASAAAQSAPYHLVDLGEAEAVAIGGSGVVAGNKLDDKRPMRWNGRWHALKEPVNDPGSQADDINDGGAVSGFVATADLHRLPAIWPRGTASWTTLTLPDGQTDGVASAITNDGRAAGSAGGGHCVVWDAAGNVTDIGKPVGATACVVTDMNADGDLTVNASSRAFIWRHGVFHDIGTVGGSSALAFGINRHGMVAGSATDTFQVSHAVTWKAGTMVDLGMPDSSWSGLAATALNDDGVAVGNGWSTNDGIPRAVLFQDGQALVLNTLVDSLEDWNLVAATGINNGGVIVGWGDRGPHHRHAFMLMPSGSN